MTRLIRFSRILTAAATIDPVFMASAVACHDGLDRLLGCELLLKIETLNPVRSFKGRGTEVFASRLVAKDGENGHIVAASAGNFGQGLARAATRRGLRSTIFAAVNASPLKVERMRELGADVVLEGQDFDAAKAAAMAFAKSRQLYFVEDGKEPAIAEGAGTIGLELLDKVSGLDAVVVPLGNGALLAGVATVLRELAPSIEIVAVTAAAAPSMKLSLEQKCKFETISARTIADGIAVRVPVEQALVELDGLYDRILAVEDDAMVAAMKLVFRYFGQVAEPSAATGIAAIAGHPEIFAGKRVATILTGGNLTCAQIGHWLTR